jgi:hypothetical protein
VCQAQVQRCAGRAHCRERCLVAIRGNGYFPSPVYARRFARVGYPSIVVSVKERSGRKYFGVVQLHDYLDLDRHCGSHFAAGSVLINSFRFFPWRRTFGQRAALSVDRPNAAHNAYQQQLHRWDRGPRKPASASVHVSSFRQCAATSRPEDVQFCTLSVLAGIFLEAPQPSASRQG